MGAYFPKSIIVDSGKSEHAKISIEGGGIVDITHVGCSQHPVDVGGDYKRKKNIEKIQCSLGYYI